MRKKIATHSIITGAAHSVVCCAGEAQVEQINQFSIYQLAQALKEVALLLGDVDARTAFFEILHANGQIDKLLAGDPLPLGVSREAAQGVKDSIQNIIDEHFTKVDDEGKRVWSFPTDGQQATIPEYKFTGYRGALSRFEIIFGAEMREAAVYFVPRRGIYSTPALINSADESFPLAIRAHIPDKTKQDWRNAGRCLAFNLLSASGFHVARAVEGTMEVYWRKFAAQQDNATLNSWNDYVQELEGIVSDGASIGPTAKTLAELRQMKDDYRNPIMHPRVILSESDARVRFDNGESLIIAMADELRAKEEAANPLVSLLGGLVPPS